MSIVDDARRRRIRHTVRHARLARAQRSRRRTEVRRASNGRPPVCASATTARYPRHVPAWAGRLHARPRRRWPAALCTIGGPPWNGARRIPTIGVPAGVASQHPGREWRTAGCRKAPVRCRRGTNTQYSLRPCHRKAWLIRSCSVTIG